MTATCGILLKNYLTAKNYETVLYINGIQALDAFKNKAFDLCILDIMMPEMDGLTVAREIRLLSPEIPYNISHGKESAGRYFRGIPVRGG